MYYKNLNFGVLCVALLFAAMLTAQNASIAGIVTVEREPMPNVTIAVENTETGSLTDDQGRYQLQLPEGEHSLLFKFMGYGTVKRTLILTANEKQTLNVDLQQDVKIMKEVIVYSGGTAMAEPESPTPIDVLKPELFEATAAASVEAVIKKIPGVQVVDGQTYFRGGNGFSYGAGSRVTYLVDGLSILTGDNGAINYDFIPQENIGAMEVIKGASSCLYGSGALNGIVNFRTAQPTTTSKSKFVIYSGAYFKPKGMSSTWWQKGEEDDQLNPYQFGTYFSDSRIVGKKLDMVSGVYYYKTKSYRNPEESEWLRFHSNLRYRVTEQLHAGVNLNFQDKKSVSFFIWDGIGNSQIDSWDLITNPINDIWRLMVDPFITYRSKKNWRHSVKTRFHRAVNTNQTNQSFASDIFYGEYRLQKKWDSLKLVLTTGASIQEVNVEGNLYANPAVTSEEFEIATTNRALFIQVDKKFGDKTNVTAGARWESNSMTGDDPEARPVFRFGINHELIDSSTYLRFSFGQGYRFPTVAERYILTDLSLLTIVGNPDLKSETGFSTELGLHQNLKLGKHWLGFAKLAVFYNRYNNMMEFVFGGQDRLLAGFQTINTGDTQILGGEVSIAGEGKIGKVKTELMGGYTYLNPTYVVWDSLKQAESTADYNVLKYRFRHNAKIDIQGTYRGWSLGTALQYYSKIEAIDKVFGDFVPDLDEYQATEAGSVFVMDLRFGKALRENLHLSIQCNNLFNRSYTLRPAILESPRYLQSKLSWSF